MLFILLNMLSRNTNIVSYLIGEQVNVIEFYYEGGNKLLCRSFFAFFSVWNGLKARKAL